MSFPSNLYRCAFEPEAAWGENVTTFANRLPIVGTPTVNLTHPKQSIEPTVQKMNGGAQPVTMPQSGEISIDLLLTGLGSSAAGAIMANTLVTLLEHAIGRSDVTQVGGTISGAWLSVTEGDVSAGAQTVPAGLVRIGSSAPKDGRGGGQAYRVNGQVAQAVTLLTGTKTPPADGDALYAMALVYPDEDPPAATMTGLRFLVAGPSKHYACHGCFIKAISFTSWKPGELPRVTLTIGVSWWDDSADHTFPDVAPTYYAGSPIAAGSMWFNTSGVNGYQVETVRDVTFSVDLQVVLLMGHADRAEQIIVGARRTRCKASMKFVVDALATPTDQSWQAWHKQADDVRPYRHVLYTLSAADGRAVAVYMPNVKPTGTRPIVTDVEGITRLNVEIEADNGGTGNGPRGDANFMIGIG